MSHPPPPPHRMGDKKRYYYSNNPNHTIRQFHPAFPKRTYGNAVVGINSPTEHAPSAASPPSSNVTRQSRYDPSAPKRAQPGKSRYNPEVESSQSLAPLNVSPNPGFRKRASSENLSTSISNSSSVVGAVAGSRYSGSRYNPTHTPAVETHAPSTVTQAATLPSNRVPVGHYGNSSRQIRPRSTELPKNEPAYQSHGFNSSSGAIAAHANPNSASNYYNRANKWRSNSGSNFKIDYENYGPGNQQANRQSFWKSRSQSQTHLPVQSQTQLQNQTSSHIQSSSESHSDSLPGSLINRSPRYFNTVPSRMSPRYENSSSITNQDKGSRESSIDSHEKDTTTLKSSNPHSLGSSLINSVPQTTRKVEEQQSTDNKKSKNDRNPSMARSQIEPDLKTCETEEVAESTEEIQEKDVGIKSPATKPKVSGMWSSLEESDTSTGNTPKEKTEDGDDDVDEKSVFDRKKTWTYDDYEFLYDPVTLKTDLTRIDLNTTGKGYSIPLNPIEGCIFPMPRAETRLWELKNQSRDSIISRQKYLLKQPLKSLSKYPFMKQNRLIFKQAVKPLLLKSISQLKRYEFVRKLQLKKEFIELDSIWKNKCLQMDEISHKLRKPQLEKEKEQEKDSQGKEKNHDEAVKEHNRVSGSSRRRNRADFVDDAEIENVLLQIDPDYKHHQLAADIPPMIIDPIGKFSKKFKDVNNLVTDKLNWASRILKDGVDTFTDHEHELFVEGYLTFPKKFGKISFSMGGLRTPEECVLHYYRTKGSVDYKRLLVDKNKKRQKGAVAKRRKKKEKNGDTDIDTSLTVEVENPGIHGIRIAPETGQQNTEVEQKFSSVSSLSVEQCVNEEEQHDASSEAQEKLQVEQEKAKKQAKSEHIFSDAEPIESSDQHQMEQVEIRVDHENLQNEAEKKFGDKKNSGEMIEIQESQPKTSTEKSLSKFEDNDAISVPEQKPSASNKRDHDLIDAQAGGDKNSSNDVSSPGKVGSLVENNIQFTPKTFSSAEGMESDPERFDVQSDDNNPQRKKPKHSGEHKSSYWSVKEANLFPGLLKTYGSQWSLISEKLVTKSTTMVRNYYQRNAAQLGWKSIVEEADFKRNVTSSGSVQQSQILIQSEQGPPGAFYNGGVPPQQRPALGFFSNSSSAKDKSSLQISSDSTPQPFVTDSNKELFSQVNTPNSTLPPPRLPSIHLPTSGGLLNGSMGTQVEEIASTTIHKLDQPIKLATPTETSFVKRDNIVANPPSIHTILNSDEKSEVPSRFDQANRDACPTVKPSTHIPSALSNVVVQELQSKISPNNGRSTSISLLLNPESDIVIKPSSLDSTAQAIPQKQSNLRSDHTIPTKTTFNQAVLNNTQRVEQIAPPNINFAMDPLGALAAIASESLMPTQSHQQEANETNIDDNHEQS